MSQNYLNIIGNWGTAAQQGRQRARSEQQMQLKTAELQTQNAIQEEQTELLVNQRLSDIHAQSEALAKLARPNDLKIMKTVESDARAKLKQQLDMYGGDVNAFMRGGGREILNEYRDAVLNSDEAQIIRNNHQSIMKYLDQSDENPSLLSERDVENFRLWQSGAVNSFQYAGAYQEVGDVTEEEVNKAGSLVEAYVHKYYDKILHNYLLDTGQEFGADGRGVGDYYQELLIYQDSRITPAQEEAAIDKISDVTSGQRSYSANLQGIFNSMNKNFIGDMDEFWFDPANNQALKNLEGISWITPYNYEEGGRNKRIYGQRMFTGEEEKIAKIFFPEMKDGKLTFEEVMAHQSNLGAGGVYGENGELLTPGKKYNNDWGFWNPNDDWSVNSVELMFEVEGPDGKMKLMTKDELSKYSPETRDQEKNAVMCLVLSEGDNVQLGLNPNDFRYIKLDLNNPRVSAKFDKAMGKIQLNSKTAIREQNPTYIHREGELFKWTPDNVNGLVGSLNPHVEKVFKNKNHTEYDINASSLLMATAMMSNDKENPYIVLNEFATSQDKEEVALIDALKESNYDLYYDLLESYGASQRELRQLAENAARIRMGYLLYGGRVIPETEE